MSTDKQAMNIPGPKEVLSALRFAGQGAFADELEALVATPPYPHQSKPAPLPASVGGVKTFGVVPDPVYGRNQFGPTARDTVEPLYVLLSDHLALRAQLDRQGVLLQRALPYLSNTPDLVQNGAEDLAEEICSVSVARDERAEFEAAYCEYFNALPGVSTPITPEQMRESRNGDHYGEGANGRNLRWAGWQMCAARRSKP